MLVARIFFSAKIQRKPNVCDSVENEREKIQTRVLNKRDNV